MISILPGAQVGGAIKVMVDNHIHRLVVTGMMMASSNRWVFCPLPTSLLEMRLENGRGICRQCEAGSAGG